MNDPVDTSRKADLRDYLAAERTLLAWIRSGLALMGFGFVVARFGLFLQQFRVSQHIVSTRPDGLSPWFGTVLIAIGVGMNVYAGWHHIRLVRGLDRGDTEHSRPLEVAVTAFFLALAGLAMAIYLISVKGSTASESPTPKEETSMTVEKDNGISDIPTAHSVDETVEKLKGLLQAKGVTLFALVDHSGEAEKAGLKMRPTKLLIFGSPKAGTPLMVAAPSLAIDLPLKILVWEDAEGKVRVSYNSPAYLQERHNVPRELLQNIAVIETLAAKAAE